MADWGRGLEFFIGQHGVIVPAALVERVVEVEISTAPPLARAWVGGLGVSGATVFVAVDLAVGFKTTVSGAPLCVLLDTGTRTGLRWALRVSKTVGFVDIQRCARPTTVPAEWPAWIAGGQMRDGSTVGLLDVVAMTRDFEK